MTDVPKAATVLLVRDNPLQVLMVRRTSNSSFMPDAFVYPGGRLDPDDLLFGPAPRRPDSFFGPAPRRPDSFFGPAPRRPVSGPIVPELEALKVAAVREAFEESGYLFVEDQVNGELRENERLQLLGENTPFSEIVTRNNWTLQTDAMHFIAHWITPISEPKRFDTYFFLAHAPETQDPSADDQETTDVLWIAPTDALARHRDKKFLLFPPTFRTLEILADFHDVASLLKWANAFKPPPILPYFLPDSETPTIVMSGDPDYPKDAAYSRFSPVPKGETRIVLQDGAWTTC